MISWRISKAAYLADFILVPAYIVLALACALAFSTPTPSWFGLFAIGFGAWTLTEYWMHREIFHRFYRQEHGLHHIRPLDWIGVSPLLTGIGFALLYLFALQFGWGHGGAAFAGYVSGYYAYIVIHILIHHTSLPIVARLRATHEMHHRGATANFGVSTNVWDHVFQTYRRP
jgi:sterol desaturase/sphingolipid hydroxylase (fatty acid hydroxylase superfamily)